MRQRHKLFGFAIAFVACSFLFGGKANAATDTCRWTGTTGTSWGTGSNWNCNIAGQAVPSNGDQLVFDNTSDSSHRTMENNIVIKPSLVSFESGSGYSVNGNVLEVDGTVGLLTSVAFNSGLFFDSTSGYNSLDIEEGGSATYAFPIDLQLTGSAYFEMIIAGSGVQIPAINGQATTVIFQGNPSHDGLENFIAPAVSHFTADNVVVWDAGFDCQSSSCFGDASNPISVVGSDTDHAYIGIGADNVSLANPIEFNTSGGLIGLSQIKVNNTGAALSGSITARDSFDIAVASGAGITLDSNVAFSNGAIMRVNGSGSSGYFSNNGVISGDGNLEFHNIIGAAMNGHNTYAGTTLVGGDGDGAVVNLYQSDSLGSASGGTTVENKGSLFLDGAGMTIAEPLTITGAGHGGFNAAIYNNTSGGNTISGTITLNGNATIGNLSLEDLVLSGKITGTGNLTYNLPGSIKLSGSAPNDYAGNTYIVNNYLRLQKSDATNAFPGGHDINLGFSTTTLPRIIIQANEQIPDDVVINTNNGTYGALITLHNAHTESIGAITGDGTVDVDSADDRLYLGGSSSDWSFGGNFITSSGGANIVKFGSETMTFNGTISDAGNGYPMFEVAEGKFVANPANTSLQFSHFGITGGALAGSSIVGSITGYDGEVSPGNSPGCINTAGDVELLAAMKLTIQLTGTTACTQYDKVLATGAISLDNPTLTTTLSFASTTGSIFTILEGSSVTGNFAGLPDNTTFVLGTRIMRINYNPTDITLTDVTPAASATTVGSDTTAGTGSPAVVALVYGVIIIGGTALTTLRSRYGRNRPPRAN